MENRAQRLLSLSPWVVSAGVAVLLAGLAWDAVLHRVDPDLAAREGIFTLTNPGHVLFGGGIAIIVAGALMFFAGRALTSPHPRVFLLPATAMTTLSIASFALAASTGTLGGPSHEHEDAVVHEHDDGTLHTHDEHLAFEAEQAASAGDSTDPSVLHNDGTQHAHEEQQASEAETAAGTARTGVLHDHGPTVAVTTAELDAAARLVTDTEKAAVRFEDLGSALAEGYYQVAPPRGGLTHYMNTTYNRDGRILDPERPESLIYLSMGDGTSKLVGVMYRMPSNEEPGPRVGGALTAWHAHDNLCIENGKVVATASNGACAKGTLTRTPEMLHVWLVENPDGVFSDDMEPDALVELLKSRTSR